MVSLSYIPAQVPQSVGQVRQLSPDEKSQIWSPHTPPQERPHAVCTSQTHVESQPPVQQYESTSQIDRAQLSHVGASARPVVHSACAQPHEPQSAGQVHAASVGSQRPFPQPFTQVPQSAAHVPQLSPRSASHLPSPHTVGHGPQSSEQVLQVSPAEQVPFPQPSGHAPQSFAQSLQFSPAQ
jgi:hypothetical protein